MPYPWPPDAELTTTDLNAAFGTTIALANSALTTASNAQALAQSTANSLGPPQPIAVTVNWSATSVTSGTYILSATLPYAFLVTSVDASVGSSGGSFTATLRTDTVVLGTGSLTVTSLPKSNFPLTAGPSNPLTAGVGAVLDVVIAVTSGTPTDSYLCLNGFRTR